MSTLPCKDPTIVRQALRKNSNPGFSELSEILWNFSHFKGKERLTLAQNPHFYTGLPMSHNQYGVRFQGQKTQMYRGKIYVITNNSRRLFLNFSRNPRAFDTVLDTNNTLIFRDIVGALEGEAIVEESIQESPPFLYHTEPSQGLPEEFQSWRDVVHKLREASPSDVLVNIRVLP